MAIFVGRTEKLNDKPIERMKRKFDTLFGRYIYNKRNGIIEPTFANLKDKGLRRFTLRGKTKVRTQWKIFALLHNIEKIAHSMPT